MELSKIIKKHRKWIINKEEGEMAVLSWAELSGAELSGAALSWAELSFADLSGANLAGANLTGANLTGANLKDADLSGANLNDANLTGANLARANISETELYRANFSCVNLTGANLARANLSGANLARANLAFSNLADTDLTGANLAMANLTGADNVPFIPIACPDTGSFIAWKKAVNNINGESVIVRLLIPEDARRTSATGRKCRCDKAVVLAIENIDGSVCDIPYAVSIRDFIFAYRVGETVVPDSFCEDRFNECSNGIHFFVNRQEAVNY